MLEKVKKILSEYTSEKEITPQSVLTVDLGLSSFDLVSLIADFEDKFDIEISDRDIHKLGTVGDIIDYLEERV